MKKFIFTILVSLLLCTLFTSCDKNSCNDNEEPEVDKKPVIYLYPTHETDVSVRLSYRGTITCTYPEYNDGWNVKAFPDGTLIDRSGKQYNCLFWEGISDVKYDFSSGFCISGDKTAEFLENVLPKLGLSQKESNEFIIYWLPLMKDNKYSLISFQNEAYTNNASLDILPEPDTVIRVFMAYKPCDSIIDIPEQQIETPERNGFTVVEWGGCLAK